MAASLCLFASGLALIMELLRLTWKISSQHMLVFNYTTVTKTFHASMQYPEWKSVAAYFSLFMLNVSKRTLGRDSIFVLENEDVLVISEETVNIFEGAIRSFRVEKVDYWNEGGVKDGPNDIKLPLEGLDADGRDFNN